MATENANTKIQVAWAGQQQTYDIPTDKIDFELDQMGNIIDEVVVGVTSSGDQLVFEKGFDYDVSGRQISFIRSITPFPISLSIARVTPATNSFSFIENEPFPASEFTAAVDRLTFMIQAQQELISRMIRFPITDGAIEGIDLPGSASRGNRILSFDEDGNPVLVDSLLQESIISVTQEPLPGDLILVTMTFASGATHSFSVPAFGATSTPVANVYMTNQLVTEDVTIPADKNGFTVGPVSISGELVIEDGATFVVINDEGV